MHELSEPRLTVGFPAPLAADQWAREHAQGLVPSIWPYGLEGLAEWYALDSISLPSITRADRLRDLIPQRRTSAGVGLTWDENTAARMQLHARREVYATGAIWVTDAAARGENVRRSVRTLRRCQGVWVLSRAQLSPLSRMIEGHRTQVEFVKFGIDTSFFTPKPAPEAPLVLSLGIDRDRDIATLYRALARVREHFPAARLLVQTTASLPAPDGVEVIGRMAHQELAELYGLASVVVVATRPNLHVSGMTVALEAMASSRPVVLTATAGMSDYVHDDIDGFTVAPGDHDAFADRIVALLKDPGLAEEFGRNGRSRVAEQHDTSAMVSALHGLLASLPRS